jgi:hypothetical protein
VTKSNGQVLVAGCWLLAGPVLLVSSVDLIRCLGCSLVSWADLSSPGDLFIFPALEKHTVQCHQKGPLQPSTSEHLHNLPASPTKAATSRLALFHYLISPTSQAQKLSLHFLSSRIVARVVL